MRGAAEMCDAERHDRHSHWSVRNLDYRATLRVGMPFWTLGVRP
ncbi:hypothetical protein ALQ33_04435 [Pseudomonas syringae pv. philadelphi]|uniref:Uncharacterized protein n=1 Tax=Pseudomonas syringae pv. philadelphi TaxID=251706 RepID=A0A3M3ZSW8_9PSED|nr:hypothetical protein ALQ33_04435 [Pseudomonas syringae pv. philadelphi]